MFLIDFLSDIYYIAKYSNENVGFVENVREIHSVVRPNFFF